MIHQVSDEGGLELEYTVDGYGFCSRKNLGESLNRWKSQTVHTTRIYQNDTNTRLELSLLLYV
jgi:hypothetical protein